MEHGDFGAGALGMEFDRHPFRRRSGILDLPAIHQLMAAERLYWVIGLRLYFMPVY